MSKFIHKLNRVSQVAPSPMGFMAKPTSEKSKILLIASLTQLNANNLVDYVAGADAGLIHVSALNSGIEVLQEIQQTVSDIPWGLWLGDTRSKGIKQLAKIDSDFIVFPAVNTPLAILQNDKTGKILEVEASLDEGLLRTVDELPVDAVLLAGEKGEPNFLTWRHIMRFQRFAYLLAKPLLVSIPPRVTINELQTIWEAGVDGVIVEVGDGQPTDRLKKLRQIIDKLDLPSQRKQAEALLPYIGQDRHTEATEEEDE